MENLYKELRSFFANDIDLTDLFDSEAIIWIDWREYDEDVVHYFNDMMDEPIDIQTVSNGKLYGDDIVLQKGDNELLIPYGDEKDRDVTIMPAYRCGKVQLIDASHCYEQRRKAIGTKRNDISDHCREPSKLYLTEKLEKEYKM